MRDCLNLIRVIFNASLRSALATIMKEIEKVAVLCSNYLTMMYQKLARTSEHYAQVREVPISGIKTQESIELSKAS